MVPEVLLYFRDRMFSQSNLFINEYNKGGDAKEIESDLVTQSFVLIDQFTAYSL